MLNAKVRSIDFPCLNGSWLSRCPGILFPNLPVFMPGPSSKVLADGPDNVAVCPRLDVYYSTGCPHCIRTLEYLDGLLVRAPEVDMTTHEVSESHERNERFIVAVGLIDGFNPCVMWVPLSQLSLLVNLRDRGRMALIASHHYYL